jgi:hypothetical protein
MSILDGIARLDGLQLTVGYLRWTVEVSVYSGLAQEAGDEIVMKTC